MPHMINLINWNTLKKMLHMIPTFWDKEGNILCFSLNENQNAEVYDWKIRNTRRSVSIKNIIYPFHRVGRDNSVGVATRCGLDGLGNECRCGWEFPHLSRPALRHTQAPIQWVQGFFLGANGWGVALNTHPNLAPRLKKE